MSRKNSDIQGSNNQISKDISIDRDIIKRVIK